MIFEDFREDRSKFGKPAHFRENVKTLLTWDDYKKSETILLSSVQGF